LCPAAVLKKHKKRQIGAKKNKKKKPHQKKERKKRQRREKDSEALASFVSLCRVVSLIA
jgi:hypothetical protein